MGVTLDPKKPTLPATTTTTVRPASTVTPRPAATGFAGGSSFNPDRPFITADNAERQAIAAQVEADGGSSSPPVTPPAPVVFRPIDTPVPSKENPPGKLENTGERLSEDQLELLSHGVYLGGGDGLANRLADPELSGAAKMQLIDELINNPNGYGDAFTSFQGEPRNVAYDNMEVVASGVADAYAAGEITDEELNSFMEEIGPERSAYFISTLSSDPENTAVGGVVEAAAEQAEALGFEQVAALGFSSSQALIDAHLPTSEAQLAAFDQVRAFVDQTEEYQAGWPRPDNVAQMSLAVGNLARLSSNGNGYSPEDFAEFLDGIDPGYGMGNSASFANEVLARARLTPGDVEAGATVEFLGKASEILAETSAEEGERAQWDVNAQIAFTSSDELIEANLPEAEDRQHAMSVLTAQSNALHDEAREAAESDPPYSLLEQPAVVDGATRLMAQHGEELIDGYLNSPNEFEGAAELTKFLENTLFSPYATSEQRGRVEEVLKSYVDQAVAGVDDDGVAVGQNVGKLLALVERAGQEAKSRAGDVEAESSIIGDVFKSVFTKLASSLATTAVTAATGGNVLAGGLAGTATNTLLTRLLGKEPDPETLREDLENKFVEMLEAEGGDIHAGEVLLGQLADVYAAVKEDVNDQMEELDDQLRNPDLTPEARQQLETQRRDLENEMEDLDDTYLAIQDTYSIILDSGQLTDALG